MAITVSSCASLGSATTTASTKEAVIDLEGRTKEDLYIQSRDWLITAFTSSKSVIQYSDKEEGIIIGKYLLYSYGLNNEVQRTTDFYAIIRIQVKDGAAKISVTPINVLVRATYLEKSSYYAYYTQQNADADIAKLVDRYSQDIHSNSANTW